MKILGYKVEINKNEDGNFVAVCIGLQGCYTEASTRQEAIAMITDAIKLHLQIPLP